MTGRDSELSEFVDQRWLRLVRTAVLLGCPLADAEDLVQSTLVRCLTHWERLRRADNVDAYVHRMLVNALRSSRRRRWHAERPTALLPEVPVTGQSGGVDRVDAVVRSLQRLSDDQRVAVVLRYYGNFSEAEMAGMLGVAAGTVKSRLARALDTLSRDPGLAHFHLGGFR